MSGNKRWRVNADWLASVTKIKGNGTLCSISAQVQARLFNICSYTDGRQRDSNLMKTQDERAAEAHQVKLLPIDELDSIASEHSFDAITMWHVLEHVHALHALY